MKKLRVLLTIERLFQLQDHGKIELRLPSGEELDLVLPSECKAFLLYHDEDGKPQPYPRGGIN